MNQLEDLIILNDNPKTPPPTYLDTNNLNRTNNNSNPNTSFSISSIQNVPPLFQNTSPPQNQHQIFQHQSGIPAVDLNNLPLSMKRNFHIQNNYPTGFIIFHSISLLFIAFLMMAAEIFILTNSSKKDINNQIGGKCLKMNFNNLFFIYII